MIVELSSIGPDPKPIDVSVRAEEIDLDTDRLLLAAPARFRGEMRRLEGKAHIRGTLTADIETNCSRCLARVTRRLDIAFDDIFVDANDETTAIETELAEADLDESLVVGGKVDIADVIREQILLAMPEQDYCKEDCKGLCPKCGQDLNLIDCSCADDDIDPRWAALKDLRS